MGIPINIFRLYRLRNDGAGCEHHLLLRAVRPEFSNADEGDYSCAVEAADGKMSALIEAYEAGVLAEECAGRHAAELLGELQARPAGDVLYYERGGFDVELWLAETRFGHPWVVLGTAESEEEFWRDVGLDEDLSSLGARPPAKRLRAYFLPEGGAR